MTRAIVLMIAASAAVAAPALTFQAQAEPASSVETVSASALDTVLAADFRADDAARDRYRHPAETLNLFRVEPTMTVAEFGPGGVGIRAFSRPTSRRKAGISPSTLTVRGATWTQSSAPTPTAGRNAWRRMSRNGPVFPHHP